MPDESAREAAAAHWHRAARNRRSDGVAGHGRRNHGACDREAPGRRTGRLARGGMRHRHRGRDRHDEVRSTPQRRATDAVRAARPNQHGRGVDRRRYLARRTPGRLFRHADCRRVERAAGPRARLVRGTRACRNRRRGLSLLVRGQPIRRILRAGQAQTNGCDRRAAHHDRRCAECRGSDMEPRWRDPLCRGGWPVARAGIGRAVVGRDAHRPRPRRNLPSIAVVSSRRQPLPVQRSAAECDLHRFASGWRAGPRRRRRFVRGVCGAGISAVRQGQDAGRAGVRRGPRPH